MGDSQIEDLRAFENRLRECIVFCKKKSIKWKIVLIGICIWIAIAFWNYFSDPIVYDTIFESLLAHKSLLFSCLLLLCLYTIGIGERYNSAKVVAVRSRVVLQNYNMSCDENGRLIMKRSRNADRWRPG